MIENDCSSCFCSIQIGWYKIKVEIACYLSFKILGTSSPNPCDNQPLKGAGCHNCYVLKRKLKNVFNLNTSVGFFYKKCLRKYISL